MSTFEQDSGSNNGDRGRDRGARGKHRGARSLDSAAGGVVYWVPILAATDVADLTGGSDPVVDLSAPDSGNPYMVVNYYNARTAAVKLTLSELMGAAVSNSDVTTVATEKYVLLQPGYVLEAHYNFHDDTKVEMFYKPPVKCFKVTCDPA